MRNRNDDIKLSSAPNASLFQPVQQKKINISIIIDPDVFFVSEQSVYYIHPIIKAWLDNIRKDDNNDICIYFLADELNHLKIKKPFTFPINSVFNSLLNKNDYQYLKELCGGKFQPIQKVTTSSSGLYRYSDSEIIPGNEIIVVTGDEELKLFFESRNISVAHIQTASYPLPLHNIELNDGMYVKGYCDFDGTLWDTNGYHLLLTLKAYRNKLTEKNKEIPVEIDETIEILRNQTLPFEQKNTIALLQELKRYYQDEIYLLTQRCFEDNQEQPPENNAIALVADINDRYNLGIKADETSFLDGRKQDGFTSKVNRLCWRIKDGLVNPIPKYILFFDDVIEEVFYCKVGEKPFAELGITLCPILIVSAISYRQENMKKFFELLPEFKDKMNDCYNFEMNKLNSALETVKKNQTVTIVQEKKLEAPSSDVARCNLF